MQEEERQAFKKMGVAVSDGRFGGWTPTRCNCQNMAVGVSKSVILGVQKVKAQAVIRQKPLKRLGFFRKDICLPSLGTLALGMR